MPRHGSIHTEEFIEGNPPTIYFVHKDPESSLTASVETAWERGSGKIKNGRASRAVRCLAEIERHCRSPRSHQSPAFVSCVVGSCWRCSGRRCNFGGLPANAHAAFLPQAIAAVSGEWSVGLQGDETCPRHLRLPLRRCDTNTQSRQPVQSTGTTTDAQSYLRAFGAVRCPCPCPPHGSGWLRARSTRSNAHRHGWQGTVTVCSAGTNRPTAQPTTPRPSLLLSRLNGSTRGASPLS